MNVTVKRTKMAMNGCHYSYDVVVAVSELPEVIRESLRYIIRYDGANYATFDDATAPAEYLAMPIGWDKYDAGERQRAACRVKMLAIAKVAFSELANVTEWPISAIELPYAGGHETSLVSTSLVAA